jgi:light-regulated signal transduction histidine kinase (bacteriophytochrome)
MTDMLRRPMEAQNPSHERAGVPPGAIHRRAEAQEQSQALEARVRELTEELERAEAEFDACAFSVSHGLRSPLGSILNFVAILEEDYRDRLDDQGRAWLERVGYNARNAVSMLDALLAFARVGRHPLALETCDVGVIAHEAIRDQQASHANAVVQVGELPACRADRELLRIVLAELVSNAFKFSSGVAAPRVELGGRETPGECVYSVRDNGVGFAMKDAQALFGTFKRLHATPEGHGMGLAVARRAVQRQGGRIWAEATPERGACFSFSLPTAPKRGVTE